MSEDRTRDLPSARSFEERLLAELAAMRADFNDRLTSLEGGMTALNVRITSLENKVDARLRETRPIWEGVQQRLTEIEASLKEFNRHLKTLVNDSFKLRARVEELEENLPTA